MKTSNKNFFSAKRANRLLLYTKNILEQHNIKYWVDSETLLGIYRDQALSSQNKYMTLGIYYDSLEKITSLKKLFFPWYKMILKYDHSGYKWIEGDITKVRLEPVFFRNKKKFGLELILKFSIGDYTRWIDGFSCKQVPSKYYNEVELLSYTDIFFPIPRYTKEYLNIRYGNWQKVITGWDSNSHDGAIINKKIMFNLSRKTRKTKPNRFRKEINLEGKNLEIIKSLLADTINLFEKHGITYWLDCGTLLGIIRDNDLLPWDHDADISISSKDVKQVLKILKRLPAKYRISLRRDYTGRLPGTLRIIRIKFIKNKPLRLLRYRELHLDILVKYKFGDYYYWIDTRTPKRVQANYHDRLDYILWNNKKYAIPSNVEQYLAVRFGNWRKPQESFDPSVDDLAIYEEIQYKPKTEGIFRVIN